MIADVQFQGLKLLTLNEFPIQGVQFGQAKAFLFLHLQPKQTETT